MTKPGEGYERFVFEKLHRFLPEAQVEFDDHILGAQSGLIRQIDISIRVSVEDQELLYIVQCKDWKKRVNITTLGEFSAVMQDVGAVKGFLLCPPGFSKSNFKYALSRGIELLTIEDLRSDKWTIEVEIPFVYTPKTYEWEANISFTATEELVERNKTDLVLNVTNTLTNDHGLHTQTLEDYVKARIEEPTFQGRQGVPINVTSPGLEILASGMWLPCPELIVTVTVKKERYLKYLKPLEYSQLRDHLRGQMLPLHFKAEFVLEIDDSYIPLGEGDLEGFPGLWIDCENWTQIEKSEGLGPQ
jgi:hypothetical protein